MYASKTQSRKWQLTINNPQAHGMTHDVIIDRAQKFNPDYFCMADEIGACGTYHTHVYLYSTSPMRFGTLKKRFPTAHIEKAIGTSQENRDYMRKEGKWAETAKAETRVEGTFKEFGVLPNEASEKSPKMAQLMQDVKDGYSSTEIIENDDCPARPCLCYPPDSCHPASGCQYSVRSDQEQCELPDLWSCGYRLVTNHPG